MSCILAESEYAEVDATFKASIELEYIFNVCFDYTSLQCKTMIYKIINYCHIGAVVARVWMNKLSANAYRDAFIAIFDGVKITIQSWKVAERHNC